MDYEHKFSSPEERKELAGFTLLCTPEDCSRRRLTFSLVMFVYGFGSIGNMGYFSLLKDVFKLQPADLNLHFSMMSFLFVLKPFYGFLTDSCPIFGRRRQPYLMLAGIVCSIMWVGMYYWTTKVYIATLLMCLINMMMGMISAVTQGLLVEDAQEKDNKETPTYTSRKAATNVSMYFGIDSIGMLASSYLSGYLLNRFSLQVVFNVSAVVPLIIVLISLVLCEGRAAPRTDEETGIKENTGKRTLGQKLKRIWHFLRIRMIYLPIIFIFLFTITPSTYDAMMYFYMQELKFNYEFIGRIQLVSSLAMLLGIAIYYKWFYASSFKPMVIISTLMATFFNLMQLILVLRLNKKIGIPDTYFALTLDLVTKTLAELQTLPTLVLACKLCPKDLEASIYECVMAIKNLAFLISYRSGGWLMIWLNITSTNFKNLWLQIVIASLFPLLTLALLFIIPIKIDYKEEFEKLENKMRNQEEKYLLNSG